MTIGSVSREETIDEIALAVSGLGMTLEEFIAEGRAGTLERPELCEQWLTHGDRLAEVDLPTPILPANTRPDPRSNREMTLHYVSREELRDRVEQDVSRVGMTLEEFIAEGKADSLTDGNLRDLWLIYGDLIVEE